jgi:hypothetical protein
VEIRTSAKHSLITTILFAAAALSGCGGGGGGDDDRAEVPNGGRYVLTVSGAQLESYVAPFGNATIRRVDLLLDGTTIASRSFAPATTAGLVGTIVDIRREAGRHTLEFQITDQTVASSLYAVNPQGFVLVQDTQSSFSKVVSLARDAALNPYTATLSTGQGIRISFDVP